MSDETPSPVNLPHYPAPAPNQGIPVADIRNSDFLMKTIRSVGRAMQRLPRRGRKGLQSDQNVHIRKRKPKFY